MQIETQWRREQTITGRERDENIDIVRDAKTVYSRRLNYGSQFEDKHLLNTEGHETQDILIITIKAWTKI